MVGVSHLGTPITSEILFNIGSCEKNFQVILALKLKDEGLISLNDSLSKWLLVLHSICRVGYYNMLDDEH